MFKNLFDQKRLKQIAKHYDGLITLMRPLPPQEIAEILSKARIKKDRENGIHREIFSTNEYQLLQDLKEMTNAQLCAWLTTIQRLAVESRFDNPRKTTDSGMRLQ